MDRFKIFGSNDNGNSVIDDIKNGPCDFLFDQYLIRKLFEHEWEALE